MIAFITQTALAATTPDGSTFELPPGWEDGPAYTSGTERVTVVVSPGPCEVVANGAPWPVSEPWWGWSTPDGAHHACADLNGRSLVAHIAPSDAPFNRYLALLAPIAAAMSGPSPSGPSIGFDPVEEDDATPIIGGLGLFGTFGEEKPAGGGLTAHFSAPSLTTGPFVGMDLSAGAAGGFLYRGDFHLGFAWSAGVLRSALYSGIGVDGITSRVRGSAEAPFGAVVFAPILAHLTLELGGEARWYTARRRAYEGGVFGFDEVEAYGGLWFARHVPAGQDDPPNGLWLGAAWKDTPDGWVARLVFGTGQVALR